MESSSESKKVNFERIDNIDKEPFSGDEDLCDMSDQDKFLRDKEIWKWSLSDRPTIEQRGAEDQVLSSNDIQIHMGKEFFYSKDTDWFWFKSIYIPSIFIYFKVIFELFPFLNLKYIQSEEQKFLYKAMDSFMQYIQAKLECETCSGKNHPKPIAPQQIILDGLFEQPVLQNQVNFSRIKFSQISKNYNGAYFRLKISIYKQNGSHSKKTENSQLIIAYYSPPILVKSKKYIKESKEDRMKHHNTQYLKPFIPSVLKKCLLKPRKNVDENTSSDIDDIQNDIDGLFEYLKSTHIKNKIKHPLYLALKFSNTIKLYFNSAYFRQYTKKFDLEKNLITKFQAYLNSIPDKGKKSAGPDLGDQQKRIDNSHFIFLIENHGDLLSINLTSKISENFLHFQHEYIYTTFNKKAIPSTFASLSPEKLKNAYIECYPSLIKLQSNSECDEISNDKDYMSLLIKNDSIDESPKKIIKLEIKPLEMQEISTLNQQDQQNNSILAEINSPKIELDININNSNNDLLILPHQSPDSGRNLSFSDKTKDQLEDLSYDDLLQKNRILSDMLIKILNPNNPASPDENQKNNMIRLQPTSPTNVITNLPMTINAYSSMNRFSNPVLFPSIITHPNANGINNLNNLNFQNLAGSMKVNNTLHFVPSTRQITNQLAMNNNSSNSIPAILPNIIYPANFTTITPNNSDQYLNLTPSYLGHMYNQNPNGLAYNIRKKKQKGNTTHTQKKEKSNEGDQISNAYYLFQQKDIAKSKKNKLNVAQKICL